MNFHALLFDLDGTLVDNMGVHQQAFDVFAERHGLPPITTELRRRLDGKRNRDIFPILFEQSLSEADLKAYGTEKETLYRELSAGKLRPVAGLNELLAELDARQIPLGISTSAPAENVSHTLNEIELTGRFAAIVRADQVPNGKPHPDVFLETASQLGVAPQNCAGFEDALMGIHAVKAAGMVCFALPTFLSVAEIEEDGQADHIVVDFHQTAELLFK